MTTDIILVELQFHIDLRRLDAGTAFITPLLHVILLLHLKSWLLGRWVSGAHIVALTQARDVTWHLGAH